MRAMVFMVTLLLAGCGSADRAGHRTAGQLNAYDVEEPAPKLASPRSAQIAYSYTYGYNLDADRIAAAQDRHVSLCRSLGQDRCLILQTERSGGDDDGDASTKLLVDARLAIAFGRRLDATAAEAGGEPARRTVSSEDLTKQLVDTGARVRAKQALAARLLAIVTDAKGNVADLVAAEKAYADVQEQLDAARTLEATLRRRVTMSDVTITYVSTGRGPTFGPVSRALGSAGESFAASMAAAITFVIAAIPWLLIVAPAFLGLRALWRRWRNRRRVTG